MQILANGQVQITNNQTGETRVVDPSQLSSFSPLLANQYYAAMVERRANKTSSGSGGTTDTLQPPAGTVPNADGAITQNVPDLSGLNRFATPVQQPKPQPKPLSLTAGLNALSTSMGGVNTMGQVATPYTVPVQYQQPQKPQPQTPQGLSTFDISKVRF